MGLKIKYWTNTPDVDTTAPAKKGKKVSKATSPFTEVEVDITTLGYTVDFWVDQKNEEKVERIVQGLPGIRYDWGYTQLRA